MDEKPSLSVNISRKEVLDFYEKFLVYKDDKIFYQDCDGYYFLYKRTSHSINFIPTGTTHDYSVGFKAGQKEIKVKFSSKDNYDSFAKICTAIETTIKPFVLINLLIQYGQLGELNIGSLNISPKGITKKEIVWFMNKIKVLPWSEFYNAQISQGNFFLYQKQEGDKKYKTFFTCPMSVMNSVILPEVLTIIFQANGAISNSDVESLKNRKEELIKPSMITVEEIKVCKTCDKPLKNVQQKFCGECGAEVNI